MKKSDIGEIDKILDLDLEDVFGFHDVGIPMDVVASPYEFLDKVKSEHGGVFLSDNGTVDGIDFGLMFNLDTSKPIYFALNYRSVEKVLQSPAIFNQGYDSSQKMLMGEVPPTMNPPEHMNKRLLVNKAFGRMAINKITEELLEPLSKQLAEHIKNRSSIDLVTSYTAIIPFAVTAKLLDVPLELFSRFAYMVRDFMAIGYNPEAGFKASMEMAEIFSGIYDERKDNLGDDLISLLMQAEIDGERLHKDEVIAFCRLLVPAGMETTTRVFGSLMVVLLRNEGALYKRIRQNRELIEPAINEVLRWEGPAIMMPKMVVSDTDLEGVEIPEGAYVCAFHGYANRDASRWDQPHKFDIDRESRSHLAFSSGPHTCLGQQLAKREISVALNTLMDVVPGLRLDSGKDEPQILGVMMRSAEHIFVNTTIRREMPQWKSGNQPNR